MRYNILCHKYKNIIYLYIYFRINLSYVAKLKLIHEFNWKGDFFYHHRYKIYKRINKNISKNLIKVLKKKYKFFYM